MINHTVKLKLCEVTRDIVVQIVGEEFPWQVTCVEDCGVEINFMHRSGNAWKYPRSEDKIFYCRNKIYVSLTHQVFQAIQDSLCLKTFSISLCYVYKYVLCLTVSSYAQNLIYTIHNHTCTSITVFVYVRHKV